MMNMNARKCGVEGKEFVHDVNKTFGQAYVGEIFFIWVRLKKIDENNANRCFGSAYESRNLLFL